MSTTPSRSRLVFAAIALAGGLAVAVPAEAAPFAPSPIAEVGADVVHAQYGYDYGRRHFDHGPRHFGYGPPRHRHFDGHRGWGGPRFGHHHHEGRGYGYGRGYGRGGW